MTFERVIFELSHGMSAMAATHQNDTISNALASLSDRLTRLKDKGDLSKLTEADKMLIKYYHQNK
jgi:ArsR family metal-binding transcriptional regulator